MAILILSGCYTPAIGLSFYGRPGFFGFFLFYVNSWGRAKEDLKNRSERCTAHSCLLGERGAMKDPVSEVIEAANAK